MKKSALFLLLSLFTVVVNAQGSRKLSSFFSEGYVKKYFNYAHVNAGHFNGVDVEDISNNKVTLKVSFEPNFFGGTYICTVYVYLDNKGRFIHVDTHCDSPTRTIWPCFNKSTSDIKAKCNRATNGNRAKKFMEWYYGKSFRQFNGEEAMCTLLNIAWFNY